MPDKRRICRMIGSALIVCHASPCAWAAFGTDNLQVRVGTGMRFENNVFRTPGGTMTPAPDGTPGRSDKVTTLNAGVSYTFPISRQNFVLSADLNQSRYAKFSNLDFDGQDLRGVWKWEAGRLLTGDAGYYRSRYQPGFSNFSQPGFVNTIGQVPTTRTTSQKFFTANYPFHANWVANVGATDATTTSSNPATRLADNQTNTYTAGLRYISGSQNYVGVQGNSSNVKFTNPQVVGGTLVDNSYDQQTASLVASYAPGGASRLTGSLGRTSRQPVQPGRSTFTGTTGALVLNWQATGKTALIAEAAHEFAPASDISTAGATTTTFSLLPTWAATAQITVVGNLRRQTRSFSDAPAFVFGGPAREDVLTTGGVSAIYNPIRNLNLNLGIQREHRTSNIPGLDYTANVYSATLVWGF